ncbi:MAG TPA: mannose-1-phosphate guanylyltransferase [Silvibacterium sp.]|nr:mannose-1-phosphate guanylyltransferase [Silvibacterium sp.]
MKTDFRPIILAGGSGTRFWPRSRKARAKQVLALDGDRTMIQRTLDRLTHSLAPLAQPKDTWVITNELLSGVIAAQLDTVPHEQIISEPAARNTAPAAGLAAFLVERTAPDAVLGIFPADHTISDEAAFIDVIKQAIAIAAAGDNMVVLGITPTRAETGYGYIETGDTDSNGAVRVRRFTEKPNRERAEQFVSAGNYHWNSGMFIWSARTLAKAVREHMPETAPHLEAIAAAFGTRDFKHVFAERYPQCENISVDYAILEPRSAKGERNSHLYCLPADFGWNDLGSWAALYEHQLASKTASDVHDNVSETAGCLAIESHRNYVYSPKKFVSLVGVQDLVIVETDDALLITMRDRSQDVGKIVKLLADEGRKDLV